MIRVYVLVEGQTEEAFVNELLKAYYARVNLYLTPIIISTSPGHKGGVIRYAKILPQIEKLCKQDDGAYVTTLFDLYALPTDFPGKNKPAYEQLSEGRAKAQFLERELGSDIVAKNFIPNFIVHEFEALLFTDISAFEEWADDDTALDPLRSVRKNNLPEEINDSPHTAPSKRIIAVMPNYQKTFHGPLIACEIGLTAIRQSCPHFDKWLTRLEQLA